MAAWGILRLFPSLRRARVPASTRSAGVSSACPLPSTVTVSPASTGAAGVSSAFSLPSAVSGAAGVSATSSLVGRSVRVGRRPGSDVRRSVGGLRSRRSVCQRRTDRRPRSRRPVVGRHLVRAGVFSRVAFTLVEERAEEEGVGHRAQGQAEQQQEGRTLHGDTAPAVSGAQSPIQRWSHVPSGRHTTHKCRPQPPPAAGRLSSSADAARTTLFLSMQTGRELQNRRHPARYAETGRRRRRPSRSRGQCAAGWRKVSPHPLLLTPRKPCETENESVASPGVVQASWWSECVGTARSPAERGRVMNDAARTPACRPRRNTAGEVQ